ncbi:MAG: hypothetical protein JW951_07055, partial [Lentisphaerae bacterium]|nr:hypothetical protein [Lentisphaerota bacterium]
DPQNRITESHAEAMDLVEERGDGLKVYRQELACKASGRYGFTTRITPRGADWRRAMPGFVTWADGD